MGTLQAISTQPAPAFAQAELKARNSITDYLALLKNWNQTRFAVVGDGLGNVTITDRTNFIYIRLGNASGNVAEARNLPLLNAAQGDSVLVRKEQPGWLGPWMIVDWYGGGDVPLVVCVNCSVQYNSQTDILAAYPQLVAGSAVAANGRYVYVAQRLKTDGLGNRVSTSKLLTYDLLNPNAPALVNTIDTGMDLSNLSAKVYENTLFVTAFEYDSATPSPAQDKRVFKYDVSAPASPSLITSASCRFYLSWELMVQGGTPYLVGYPWMTGNLLDELIVMDGDTLTEVGTLGGIDFLDWKPTVVGSYAFAGTGTAPFPSEANAFLAGFDLTTPSSPALMWTDAGTNRGNHPLCAISATQFYAKRRVSGFWLFDITTPAVISKTQLTNSIQDKQYGWQAYNDCLFQVQAQNAFTYDISTPLSPLLTDSASAPVVTGSLSDGREADVGQSGGKVYLSSVGLPAGIDGEYLNVFTSE